MSSFYFCSFMINSVFLSSTEEINKLNYTSSYLGGFIERLNWLSRNFMCNVQCTYNVHTMYIQCTCNAHTLISVVAVRCDYERLYSLGGEANYQW